MLRTSLTCRTGDWKALGGWEGSTKGCSPHTYSEAQLSSGMPLTSFSGDTLNRKIGKGIKKLVTNIVDNTPALWKKQQPLCLNQSL